MNQEYFDKENYSDMNKKTAVGKPHCRILCSIVIRLIEL
jgi:hypothetical protein